MYTPSDSEYASAWASDAKREAGAARAENGRLAERVDRLEQDVQLLVNALLNGDDGDDFARDALLAVKRATPTEMQQRMRKRVRDQRNGV